MSKTKVLMVLLTLIATPMAMFADLRKNIDRLEFGVSAGVGFYVGQDVPVAGTGLERVQSYDAVAFGEKNTLRWPGIETFGFNVGYRFDSRWTLVANTVRQRVCFAEYDNNAMTVSGDAVPVERTRGVYYNAMWHVDVMAEYNILNYGNIMMPRQKVYNVVPYVGLGFGVTVFNKNATLRSMYGYGDINSFYPRVGYAQKDGKYYPAEVAAALYIPAAVGVKWRINDNVQLKGTFQYQLYFASKNQGGLSANLEGASYSDRYKETAVRPTFDELDKVVAGKNHNCLFSISAIFNIGKWYEDRLITY